MGERNPAGMLTTAKLCIPWRSGVRYTGLPFGDCNASADRHDGVSGLIWLAAFFSYGQVTLDSIGLYCSTGDAGKELKFVVYDIDLGDGLPNNLLGTTGVYSIASPAFVLATSVGLSLPEAGWHCVGHLSNSSSTAKFEVANNAYGWLPWGDTGSGLQSYKSANYAGIWPTPPTPFPVPSFSGELPFRYVLGFV